MIKHKKSRNIRKSRKTKKTRKTRQISKKFRTYKTKMMSGGAEAALAALKQIQVEEAGVKTGTGVNVDQGSSTTATRLPQPSATVSTQPVSAFAAQQSNLRTLYGANTLSQRIKPNVPVGAQAGVEPVLPSKFGAPGAPVVSAGIPTITSKGVIKIEDYATLSGAKSYLKGHHLGRKSRPKTRFTF